MHFQGRTVIVLFACVLAVRAYGSARVAESDTTVCEPILFTYENIRDHIFGNLSYPAAAIDSNIQGTVMVRFTITPTGEIDTLYVTKAVHPLLDAEALRLFREMPRWRPVMSRGKPVALTYDIPVIFELVEPDSVSVHRREKP